MILCGSEIKHSSAHSGRMTYGAGQFRITLWMLLITVALFACTTPPKPVIKSVTYAYEPQAERRLAVVARQLLKNSDLGDSGFFMVTRNDDALRWRLLLTDLAEETLDMQYFIWKGDASGVLLLDRVIKAADRGVRLRILVDDLFVFGADRAIAALSQHPQIKDGDKSLIYLDMTGNIDKKVNSDR
jgi:putative cardiolipin synthase